MAGRLAWRPRGIGGEILGSGGAPNPGACDPALGVAGGASALGAGGASNVGNESASTLGNGGASTVRAGGSSIKTTTGSLQQ
ncbi:hypothetical protein [Streptomyces sp. NPDC056387]|uniref:hypothetical protein n=1 Tax=Streptomyces sp. NPDC056387 TaxID=3345803 RepID=UPI0035DBC13C